MFEFGKKGGQESTSDPLPQELKHSAAPPQPTSGTRSPGPAASRRDAAIIGPSITIDGDLKGQEDLLIEGQVKGKVELRTHSLTVGSHGKVRADAYAKEIFVDGLVEGNLYASERVAIRKTAQVRGDITSPRVSLEEGAKFKGSIEMDQKAVESALGIKAAPGPAPGPSVAPPKPQAPLAGSPIKSGTGS
jgi:cytoskeletal protein CcmA (bactofilin family)